MGKSFISKISIPQPCSENWENMAPGEQGRHCASCNKTVIDFSLFSDKQLVDFFSKASGKVCGRFNSFQLERELVYVEPRNHFLYKLLFGTALTAGLAYSANANYNPNGKPLVERYSLYGKQNNEEALPQTGGDSLHCIKGTVVDNSKTPLPFAMVVLFYNEEKAGEGYTDINGSYKIDVPDSLIGKTVTIKSVYPGYKDFAEILKIEKLPLTLTVLMESGPAMILGGPIFVPIQDGPDLSNPDHYTIRRKDTPY